MKILTKLLGRVFRRHHWIGPDNEHEGIQRCTKCGETREHNGDGNWRIIVKGNGSC